MAKRYTVSDGKLVLTLEEAQEGGFVVTSPLDPGFVTEAESITEAFMRARDALPELARSRRDLRPRRPGRSRGGPGAASQRLAHGRSS